MKCPKCDASISMKMNQCSQCGQALMVYKRVIRISNTYYNIGLEKAKVHDLSGAKDSLRKSLQFNKKNTDTRNLLGLIYYEMGETVAALSEWVISKHLQQENNSADRYIDFIQSNPTRLESINQTIKKYNSALFSAKHGNADLAIIQLKKVTSLNPKFVRAQQLIALLYMKNGERLKALKSLQYARRVDLNNTLTLKYLLEFGQEEMESGSAVSMEGTRHTKTYHGEQEPSLTPIGSYKEDNPKVLPFINVLIGIMIGLAVATIFITSTYKNADKQSDANSLKKYSEELAKKESTISSLQNENTTLTKKVTDLEATVTQLTGTEETAVTTISIEGTAYDALFKSVLSYLDNKDEDAAVALAGTDEASIVNESAKTLYAMIKEETFEKQSQKLFEKGRETYNNGKYAEAIPILEQSVQLKADNVDAIYFMGRCYHRQDDLEKAKEYYTKIMDSFPDSTRVTDANTKLNEIKEEEKQ